MGQFIRRRFMKACQRKVFRTVCRDGEFWIRDSFECEGVILAVF